MSNFNAEFKKILQNLENNIKDKEETNANGEIVEKDKYAKYKEKPLDPNDEVKNGPYEDDKRQCRDCFCCIFFIVFIIGIIVVSYLGLYKGHPELILYPYDSDQNQCGRGDAKDYKYLYFNEFINDTVLSRFNKNISNDVVTPDDNMIIVYSAVIDFLIEDLIVSTT